jgi:hypothetical protein
VDYWPQLSKLSMIAKAKTGTTPVRAGFVARTKLAGRA